MNEDKLKVENGNIICKKKALVYHIVQRKLWYSILFLLSMCKNEQMTEG